MSSLLRGLSGYLSDRFKRRKIFVAVGYGTSALAKPLTALAFNWWFVLGTRLFDRFGKSVRTAPRDALISAQVGPENRGYAFGFHRAMDTTGAVLGPLIAMILLWWLGHNYRPIFVLACIPAAIGVLIVIGAVREVWDEDVSQKAAVPTLPNDPPSEKWLNPDLVKFFIVAGLFALGNSSNAFILLRAREVFSGWLGGSGGWIGADTLAIGGYVLFNLSFALLAVPMGMLSDRLGRRRVIVAGYVVYALLYAALAFAANVYTLWTIFFVYGVYEALTHGVTKALVADLAPARYRGTALGAVNTVEGLGTLAAGLLTGFLWQYYGAATAFMVDAILALAAAGLFLSFRFSPAGQNGR